MIPHFGFRPADDAVITTLHREAEMRSVRLAVHAARLDLERKRLADEGAKAEQERKRRRNRLIETAALVITGVVLFALVALGAGPFNGIGR